MAIFLLRQILHPQILFRQQWFYFAEFCEFSQT